MFDSFYNDCIKKNTIAFASLFNNIYVNREDTDDSKKIKVPFVYGGKEKYVSRLQNPSSISDKDKLQITLPMMSFDMSNLQYDTQRHRNKLEFNKLFYQEEGETKTKIKIGEYPCLMQFNLAIYTRNIEENFQIIEQIAPYFTPEYILTLDFDKTLTRGIDVPINLVASKIGNDYEGGFGNRRAVVSTLQFVMRTYLFGPEREATPILTTDFNLNTQDSFLQFITDVQVNDDLYLDNQSITVTWRQGGIFPRNPTIVITNLTNYIQEIVYDPETFDVGDGTNSVTFAIPASAPLLQDLYVRVFLGTVSDNSPAFEVRSAAQNISLLQLANFSGTTFSDLMSSNHYFFTQSGVTQFPRGNNLVLAYNYGSYNDLNIKTPGLLEYYRAFGLTFRANTIDNPQIPFGSVIHNGMWAGISYDQNRVLPCLSIYMRPGANVNLYANQADGVFGTTQGSLANRRTSEDMFQATYGSQSYYINGFWGWNGTTSIMSIGSYITAGITIESGFSGYIYDKNNQSRYPDTGKYSTGVTHSQATPSIRTLFDPTFTQKLYPYRGATGLRAWQITAFGSNNPANLLFDSNVISSSTLPIFTANPNLSGSDFNYLDNNDKMRLGTYMDCYRIAHNGNTYLIPSPFTANLVTDMLGFTAYKSTGFTGREEFAGKFGTTYVGGWNKLFNFVYAGKNINGVTFTPPTPCVDIIFNDHELRWGLGLGADAMMVWRFMLLVDGLTTAWINRVKQDEFWPNLEAKYAEYPGLSFDRIFDNMKNSFIQFTSGPLSRKGLHGGIQFSTDALPLNEFYDNEVRKYWYGLHEVSERRSPGCKFAPVHVNRIPKLKSAARFNDITIQSFSQGVTLPYELIYHYPNGYPYTYSNYQARYRRTGYGPTPSNPVALQGVTNIVINFNPSVQEVNISSDKLLPWFIQDSVGQTGTSFNVGISYNQTYFETNQLPTSLGNGTLVSFFGKYEEPSLWPSVGRSLSEKYEPFFAIKHESKEIRGVIEENMSHGVSGIFIYNNVLFNRVTYHIPHGYENSWFMDSLPSVANNFARGFTYNDPAIFSKTDFSGGDQRQNPNYQPINFYHSYNENIFISKLLTPLPLNILNQSVIFQGPITNINDSSPEYYGIHPKSWNNFKYNDEILLNHILWDIEVATHGRTYEYLSSSDDISMEEALRYEVGGFNISKLNPALVSKVRLLGVTGSDQNLILHRITLPIPYILTTDYAKPEQGSYYDDWYNNHFVQNVLATSVEPSTGTTLDNINLITTGNRDLDFYTKSVVTESNGSHSWSTLRTDNNIRRFSVDVFAGTQLVGNLVPSKYYPMGVWLVTDEVSILPDGTTFNNYNLIFQYRDAGPMVDGITTAPYRT
jgi:hypothetical protein